MTFGKGIASGYPLAAVVGKSDIMNNLQKGSLGGTYGGNAICSIAASATIDILKDIYLKDDIEKKGNFIKINLHNDKKIREIRQYGLMIGIEFTKESGISALHIADDLRNENILVLVDWK